MPEQEQTVDLGGTRVAVIGAGTMGAGIAQIAATAGHSVVLYDIAEGAPEAAVTKLRAGMERLIQRGKFTAEQVDTICGRIQVTSKLEDIATSGLVIEAILEDLDVKRQVFRSVEQLCEDSTVIASNTSSISISALAAGMEHPGRFVGMHFFNPAAIMKLVEVVSGLLTTEAVADAIFGLAKEWGKTPVNAKSTPGFIVNRVARPFYAEALRSVSERVAPVSVIDAVLKSCGGFKMGPLELTDLIGHDVNAAVTESVYRAMFEDPRYRPSVVQTEMVAAGLLGRKSGRGFYRYDQDGATASEPVPYSDSPATPPTNRQIVGSFEHAPSLMNLLRTSGDDVQLTEHSEPNQRDHILAGSSQIQVTNGASATSTAHRQNTPNLVLVDLAADYLTCEYVAVSFAQQASAAARADALGLFEGFDKKVCVIKDVPGMLVMRTVAMLINQAADAVDKGICSANDVDVALQAGAAYPQGLMAWGDKLGVSTVVEVLQGMQSEYGEDRYRCSPLLLRHQYGATPLVAAK